MTYSIDLRERVLDFVENGGSKVEAAKLFNISRDTIYKWQKTPEPLVSQKPGPKGPRSIEYTALQQHVKDFPDQTLNERAAHFGVSHYCIWYGLRKLGISRKKTLGYKERCEQKRATYCEHLASEEHQGKSLVYIDESGFRSERYRRYGYAPKGEPVFDLISSQSTRATTLLAARIDNVLTTHALFEGSCNAERFNTWLGSQLCPHLGENHLVLMDNARIHRTQRTRNLWKHQGHPYCICHPIHRTITRLNTTSQT